MSRRACPRPPAPRRAAGSAMSVSASSSAAIRARGSRALDDPLVGRVDQRRQLGVGEHALGHSAAEAGDPDPRRPSPRSLSTEVSVPRAASSSPTCAVALPRPMGPRTASISQVSVSVSPGSTTRLKRQSSMPAKNAILPRFSSFQRTATAPPAPSPRRSARPHHRPARKGRRTTGPRRAPRAGDDAAAGLELEHLVEQQEGLAVEGLPRSPGRRRPAAG